MIDIIHTKIARFFGILRVWISNSQVPNHPKDGQRHGGAAGSTCKSGLVLVLLAGNPGTQSQLTVHLG